MSTSKRTLFACTWCGAEQIMLDLDPRAVADATEAWHAEHDPHNPHHDEPRCCDECGSVSPVQAVDDRRVIGVTTFDQQAFMDWLGDHDCTARQSEQLKAWIARRGVGSGTPASIDELLGPRPSWSEPARDVVTKGGGWSCHRSAVASVMLRHPRGDRTTTGDGVFLAQAHVSAKRFGPEVGHVPAVGLTIEQTDVDGKWRDFGATLMVSEARELADTLNAAADLAESA